MWAYDQFFIIFPPYWRKKVRGMHGSLQTAWGTGHVCRSVSCGGNQGRWGKPSLLPNQTLHSLCQSSRNEKEKPIFCNWDPHMGKVMRCILHLLSLLSPTQKLLCILCCCILASEIPNRVKPGDASCLSIWKLIGSFQEEILIWKS